MEAEKKHTPSTPFLAVILACGALVLFVCLIIRYFTTYLGHDQSSYLFEAQRLLSGAELYGPHLSETNPPMIVWFSALPVLLTRYMHGSPAFFLKLLVVVMILGSVAWCVRILRRDDALANPITAGLLGCAILAIEFSIGAYEFGQREQLLIILLFPYVLAVATGAVNRLSFVERCALGVSAAIAIWFKPQDVLVIVGLELFLSFRARSLRRALTPEFLALVLTSSFVLALVRIITPLYTKVTLPLLFDTYWALGTAGTVALELSLHHFMAELLVISLGCFFLRKSLRDPATSIALLICSITASFAFAMQHTSWNYHRFPYQAFLLLALAYLLADLLYPVIGRLTSDARFARRTLLIACAIIAVPLCVIAVRPHFVIAGEDGPIDKKLDQFLAQCEPSTTVYVFSTSVPPLDSAFTHNLRWGSRFAHLWMLPAIIQNELGPTTPKVPYKRLSPETLTRLAALQRTESAEDLNYFQPSVVLVEHCNTKRRCQGIEGKNFDMISWFQQSPEFSAAWSHYQQQPGLDDFDVYKLIP